MSKIIMSLDQGTTSSRTILFDGNGKIIAEGSPSDLVNNIEAKSAYFGDSFSIK